MNLFKALGVSSGITLTYKQPEFETNLRLASTFGSSINGQESGRMLKQ